MQNIVICAMPLVLRLANRTNISIRQQADNIYTIMLSFIRVFLLASTYQSYRILHTTLILYKGNVFI